MKFKTLVPVILAASLAACTSDSTSTAPTVGSSSDLSAFEGAKAGQAEMGIQKLG